MNGKVVAGVLLVVAVAVTEGRSVRKDLSESQIAELDQFISGFRSVDSNGDMSWSRTEIEEMPDMPEDSTQEEIDQAIEFLMSLFDTDGDGEISAQEMITVALIMDGASLERIEESIEYIEVHYNDNATMRRQMASRIFDNAAMRRQLTSKIFGKNTKKGVAWPMKAIRQLLI